MLAGYHEDLSASDGCVVDGNAESVQEKEPLCSCSALRSGLSWQLCWCWVGAAPWTTHLCWAEPSPILSNQMETPPRPAPFCFLLALDLLLFPWFLFHHHHHRLLDTLSNTFSTSSNTVGGSKGGLVGPWVRCQVFSFFFFLETLLLSLQA